jgi:hypothetical protein
MGRRGTVASLGRDSFRKSFEAIKFDSTRNQVTLSKRGKEEKRPTVETSIVESRFLPADSLG